MTARLVGINHVALEVGDIDAGARRSTAGSSSSRSAARTEHGVHRHGRPVHRALERPQRSRRTTTATSASSSTTARPSARALREAGVESSPGRGLDFLDPWGNHIQVVDYRDIQFTKSPAALRAVGGEDLVKSPGARREMAAKGLLDG